MSDDLIKILRRLSRATTMGDLCCSAADALEAKDRRIAELLQNITDQQLDLHNAVVRAEKAEARVAELEAEDRKIRDMTEAAMSEAEAEFAKLEADLAAARAALQSLEQVVRFQVNPPESNPIRKALDTARGVLEAASEGNHPESRVDAGVGAENRAGGNHPKAERLAPVSDFQQHDLDTLCDPLPADVWPSGCRSPNSCARHGECMYMNCQHQGRDIKGEIAAASEAQPKAEVCPTCGHDAIKDDCPDYDGTGKKEVG
jgi:hypothetical protein